MTEKTKNPITLTHRVLIFGGGFWTKICHTPTPNQQHSYWLHKLNKKMEAAQKKNGKAFRAFLDDLGGKYGIKTPEGKVMMQQNGLPQAKPEERDAFDDMLDKYMDQTLELGIDKIPLQFFEHINKTPMDWEALEQVAEFTEEDLAPKVESSEGPRLVQG